MTAVMVRGFLTWWVGQLTSLLPGVQRRRGPDGERFTSITLLSPLEADPINVEVATIAQGRPTAPERVMLAGDGMTRLRALYQTLMILTHARRVFPNAL